jgi:hypothetical protein
VISKIEGVYGGAAKECNCTAANNGYNGFPKARQRRLKERDKGENHLARRAESTLLGNKIANDEGGALSDASSVC